MSAVDLSSITLNQAKFVALNVQPSTCNWLTPACDESATSPQAGWGAKQFLAIQEITTGLSQATVKAIRLHLDVNTDYALDFSKDGSDFVLNAIKAVSEETVELWRFTVHDNGSVYDAAVIAQAMRVGLNRLLACCAAVSVVSVLGWFNHDDEVGASIELESIEQRAHTLMLSRQSLIQREMMTLMIESTVARRKGKQSGEMPNKNIYDALCQHFDDQVEINTSLGIYELIDEDR